MRRGVVRSGLLTAALLGTVVIAALLGSSPTVRITDVGIGECFVYDRAERITSVETIACEEALAIAASTPDGPVAALVVWRGSVRDVQGDPTDAIDRACGPFRVDSPVVIPVVFEEPPDDGADGLCLALGR
jgi:hypothetical protein